jgi:glucokinase
MPVISIDLGGTKISAAIVADDGTIRTRRLVALDGRSGVAVGRLLTDLALECVGEAQRLGTEVRSVGVAVPGISRQAEGTIWAPNIPGWENYPLKQELDQALPHPKPTVRIESDRSCAILGETWLGAARGCSHAIFLAVGTGIGAGILIGGRILRGVQDIAGAIGWTALDRPYREEYVSCGCFESHASGDGIARVARVRLAANPEYRGRLRSKDPRFITAQDLFEAYDGGDQIAVDTIREAIQFWGMTAANLISLFNPEKIIFGGGVFGPAARFLPEIRAEAHRWAQPLAFSAASIEETLLGGDAVLLGAARLATGDQ